MWQKIKSKYRNIKYVCNENEWYKYGYNENEC